MKELLCLLWYGLIVANLTGHVSLSWWLVLAPVWMPFACVLVLIPIMVVCEFLKLMRTVHSGQDYNPYF
jgi:hypothetical protein